MPTAKNSEERIRKHPNVKARVLPHNDEAEQAVLSCVLIRDNDTEAAIAILSELRPDDFYEKAHRETFAAMLSLYNKDRPIDLITLVQELEEMGEMETVGGIEYIAALASFLPSTDNYAHYMAIVKKNSLLRQLITATQKVMDCAFSSDADEDALSLAEREIYALAEKEERSAVVPMIDAVERAMEIMDEKQKNPTAQNTVPIPFEKLNELLGGFHKSDLVLIAARPAQGKTSLGMNLISHAALDKSRRTPAGKVDPFKCAVFSLEMSAEQIATRLICSVAKVSMSRVSQGKRTPQDNQRIMEAQKKLSEAQIFIDDNAMTTPIEILSKCRRLKRDKGLDLVLIDYLQLMQSGKKVESRQQEVADITRTLKIAAKELNVPILLLSQMSRDIEKRTDKKPQMSDLRESGAIEQDADIIMFLHREHNPNDQSVDEDTRTKCDIIVAKHRNGSTDTVTVRWHGEYTTFTDLYEKSSTTAINITEPSFKDSFIGVDEPPTPDAPEVELPPVDGIVEPKPVKKTAEPEPKPVKPEPKPEHSDGAPVDTDAPPEPDNAPDEEFVTFDDPFTIPFTVTDDNDDDII